MDLLEFILGMAQLESNWEPIAETTNEDKYGADLSISRNGKNIAIGVPGFDGDAGDDSGAVQTREWVTSEDV